MPVLFWLVADPTAQMLAGEIAVRLAKPSLMVGLGLATICQDAAYAADAPIITEVIMAAAKASSPRNASLDTRMICSLKLRSLVAVPHGSAAKEIGVAVETSPRAYQVRRPHRLDFLVSEALS
jgi:hypothetical protein